MVERRLWDRMKAVSERALESGHLISIPSEIEIVEDKGIYFVVRYAPLLIEKITAALTNKRNSPFLPPEPELFVESISDDYNLILNKFNVLECHGLLTTKNFVSQTDLLTISDFDAVASVLKQEDALVFYNGGKRAGASQTHRHFQIVPKDLGAGVLPIDGLLRSEDWHKINLVYDFQMRSAHFPVCSAELLLDAWQKMEYCWQEYNLLITREWMMVVPRSEENVSTKQGDAISFNSLAFAGALLVKNINELELVKSQGPIALMHQVTQS